ncbi:hypothetical protein [Gordonia sp. (in: high G+C Gram-positive bacteria)]|nr:hypothetical protein [Gordonia sp. (in: high G+C Gram-positive bacteria)]HMS76584.1 hypothetical protein [Gordonia sp. (in: high G+C Gram-positive bacteria)]HQV18146.1 hypothetical protein [Gordonia sp. (in: high G+C Gram-positive bacteria)]
MVNRPPGSNRAFVLVMASAASGVAAGAAVHGDLGFADLAQMVRTARCAE